jgi:hypothetical protein
MIDPSQLFVADFFIKEPLLQQLAVYPVLPFPHNLIKRPPAPAA